MAQAFPPEAEDDFYGVLNVPRSVGISGLQTAYARLADDLATRMSVDPTARDQLIRLNRAFGVLGNSDLRKDYDAKRFSDDLEPTAEELSTEIEEQKGRAASNILFASLIGIVAIQVIVVSYIGRTEFGDMVSAVMNALIPGGAS